jgi:hypothetical protein
MDSVKALGLTGHGSNKTKRGAIIMNKMAKVLGISVVAVGLLGACSEQEVKKTDASPEVQQKVSENKPATAPAPKKLPTAKVGETLDVDGVKITVTGIDKFAGRINQFSPLKQDHAVKIGVIVENTTTEGKYVMSNEFKLYDKDGFELGSALPGDEDALSSEIPGGKKIQGAVYFDVPKQDGANWELQYNALANFNGEPAKWEVPAK